MWKVSIFGSDSWQEAHTVEVSGWPTIDALLDASRTGFPNAVDSLHKHLESEREYGSAGTSDLLGRQPISIWAKLAEEQSREFNWSTGTEVAALDGEAVGLYQPDSATGKPTVVAWHEPTAVIIWLPGTPSELQIECIPDTDAEDRLARLRYRYATPDHVLETVFDWRGYFGPRSAIVDGWNEMRGNGRGFIARLRGSAGYVVGRALRRLTFGNPTLERDRLFVARERSAARRYAHIANACPVLSERNEVPAPHAMVFVHGTLSCGVQGLKDLFDPSATPHYPVRRFEHDTCRPLAENATELARLIKSSVRVRQLLLVAHSRGGLVARLAMQSLARDNFPARMTLQTFGTPHNGTPLVAVGARLLSQLYKIGEWGLGITAPALSPLTWAHGFLFDAPVLPPGIAVMAENSSELNSLNLVGDPSGVTCWGSRFDANGPGSGFGIEVEGLLRGAMYDIPNDLVVPTSSTVVFGSPEPLLTCSHLQYFSQPGVQARLRNHFDSASIAAPPAGSCALSSTIVQQPSSAASDAKKVYERNLEKLKETAKKSKTTLKKK